MLIVRSPSYLRLSRPLDSSFRIKTTLARYSCSECGKCCKETPVLLLRQDEPSHDPLLLQITERRIRTESVGTGTLVHFPNRRKSSPGCTFLEGNLCTVYQSRSLMCHAYPFIAKDAFVDGIPYFLAVLTSACPPLSDLKNQGVGYITAQDMGIRSTDGVMRLDTSLLGNSVGYISQLIPNVDFLKMPNDGPVYFLID